MLDEAKNNYLCVLYVSDGAADAGVCFSDCSTGEIHLTRLEVGDFLLPATGRDRSKTEINVSTLH